MTKKRNVSCEDRKGIKVTDNQTGREFFFNTEDQNKVENVMLLMGYGCGDYNLSFFKDNCDIKNKRLQVSESARQLKYDKFWEWINPTLKGYSSTLDMLLHMLTEVQLDELLVDIADTEDSVVM